MKRLLFALLTVASCFILLPVTASAAPKPIKTVSGSAITYDQNTDTLYISQTSASIYIGGRLNLKVNGVNKYVAWKTSNKDVATVTKQGRVVGIGDGTANITAIVTVDGGQKKLNCQVTVKSRLSANQTTFLCNEGEYQEVNIFGTNLKANEHLFYEVDDEYTATVESTFIDGKNTLKIIPEKIGATKVFVYIGKNEDSINYNDRLEINVLVTDDKDWISPDQMTCLLGDDYLETLFGKYSERDTPEYNGYEIEVKYVDHFFMYFNTEDLKEAGIL